MSDIALEAENLCRDYGGKSAVNGVSLAIRVGRVAALLGPNGAGKTTLLHLLTGQLSPSRGEVAFYDQPVRPMSAELCHRMAFVGDSHPPRWATLANMIDLQAAAYPGFDRSFASQLIKRRDVAMTSRYATLSKGQKRWSLSALALASRPSVLIMDEPADGLDPAARRELFDHLRDAATERGTAVLVATHIITDIERVADDAVLIDAGRIVLDAPLEDLREQVRQVQLPSDIDLPTFDRGLTLIHQSCRDDAQLLWVRSNKNAEDPMEHHFGEAAIVRPVSLESLYLAVIEKE